MKLVFKLKTIVSFLSIFMLPMVVMAQNAPEIVGGPTLGTFHAGIDGVFDEYGINLNIQVNDPQGLETIASVTVTGPEGTTVYTLYDDGNHCDGPSADGNYNYQCGGNEPNPPPKGTYTFTVKDADGNTVSATANLSGDPLDIPRNLSPANNAVVDSLTPTFSWNPVEGTTGYNIGVWRTSDGQQMWNMGGISETTVVYNSDGSGSALLPNTLYSWGVGANDDQNNNSWHHGINFMNSSGGDPIIISGPVLGSVHFGVDGGDEQFGLNLNVGVLDPQGLETIASVTVTGPDDTTYTLYDDGNHCDGPSADGNYNNQCGGNEPNPPAPGTYTFTVEDADGNSISEPVEYSGVILDIPSNLSPANNALVDSLTPTFSWDPVQGAAGYDIEVRNPKDWQWMWGKNGFTSNSLVYNDDETGNPLVENTVYQWGVVAHDNQGNTSWHHTSNSFVYSTGDKPAFTQAWVGGREQLNVQGFHEYAIHLQATVFDPQGLSDIDSVVVTGPDNASYTLLDDGMSADNGPDDGVYGKWVGWENTEFPKGTYTFTVTDNSGNDNSMTDTLEEGLDPPTNVSPANGEVLFTPQPIFSWEAPGSPNGGISVSEFQDNYSTWGSPVTGTSIAYGGSALKPGTPYRYDINANDTSGNSASVRGTFLYYPTRKVADTWYDHFDIPYIDRNKWNIWYDQQVLAREIVDGELRLEVESDPSSNQRVSLRMTETSPLTQLEAKVLVSSETVMENGAWGYARIAGTFYNESRGPGSGYDYQFTNPGDSSSVGDVWVELKLVTTTDTSGKLKANAYIERADTSDFNQSEILLNENLPILLDYDTGYVLKITRLENPNRIVFDCGGEQITYTIPSTVYEPYGKDYKLRSRVYANTNEDQYGYIRTRYDDVYIDKGNGRDLYDNFSSPNIDLTKWSDPEEVREVKDGKLRMVTFGAEGRTTTSIPMTFYQTNYIEAKIALESGGYLDPDIRSMARISGNFYNDTYGPGEYQGNEGEVWATVYLNQYGDGTRKAKYYAERAGDPNWDTFTELISGEFTTPIELDREYRTSLEMTGTELIFKLDDERIVYPIQTSVKPTSSTWRALQTRVYAEPGTSGLIKAHFDDVRVWKRQYDVGDVITVLKTLTGQRPAEIIDVDNFADPSSIGMEDALYILQNVAGFRNWP